MKTLIPFLILLGACVPETGYRVHVYQAEVLDHDPRCLPPLIEGGSPRCYCWDGLMEAPCDVDDPGLAPDPYVLIVGTPDGLEGNPISRSTAVRQDTYAPSWEETIILPADSPLSIVVLMLDVDSRDDDDLASCSFPADEPLPAGSFWCGDLDKGGSVALFIERI